MNDTTPDIDACFVVRFWRLGWRRAPYGGRLYRNEQSGPSIAYRYLAESWRQIFGPIWWRTFLK